MSLLGAMTQSVRNKPSFFRSLRIKTINPGDGCFGTGAGQMALLRMDG